MKNKKSQQGIALIWVIVAAALLITGAGVIFVVKDLENTQQPQDTQVKEPSPRPPTPEEITELDKLTESLRFDPQSPKLTNEDIYKDLYDQEPLLKVLPPKERKEYGDAIRQAQEVLNSIQPYNPSDFFNRENMFKGLDQVNKRAREQIQTQPREFTPPQIDQEKLNQYLKENPQYPPGSQPKSPREQGIEEFEEKTGIDLDAPR